MSYSIRISSSAEWDLFSIGNYITYVLCSYPESLSQVSKLSDSIAALDEMPERYPLLNNALASPELTRIMPVGHYSILYQVDGKNKVVEVLRIIHGGVDRETSSSI